MAWQLQAGPSGRQRAARRQAPSTTKRATHPRSRQARARRSASRQCACDPAYAARQQCRARRAGTESERGAVVGGSRLDQMRVGPPCTERAGRAGATLQPGRTTYLDPLQLLPDLLLARGAGGEAAL